ncbi:hypothetical protein C9374_003657 [Naegleria lovaniensis]|uniref:Uncharacterized protein n=1 Tax=Naegleria lovaniensis TaxID=51637 RepID=A0AA88KQ51_NAELO|nr:uncharacterized protein C9374_003657 [Naegleria lovaniensis]KAG2393893.1 hypothetical protein C9374_003657 [Naegleria lovaniensis]
MNGLAGIDGSSPNHWWFGQKKSIRDESAATTETLGRGFPSFYTSEFPPIVHGDTTKKHFSRKSSSEEMTQKPQIKVIEEPQPNYRTVRKKLVPEPANPDGQKIKRKARNEENINCKSDIQQLFGVPKPKKIYDDTGQRMSEKRGDEMSLEYFIGRKNNSSNPLKERTTMLEFTGKSATVMYPSVLNVHSDHPKYIHPSGERICETLSKTTRSLMDNNEEFYRRMRMQEIEAERKKDIELVLELDKWLPPSVKSKLDEEEQKEALRDQQLEQRRKKVLGMQQKQPSKNSSAANTRPQSSKKKK